MRPTTIHQPAPCHESWAGMAPTDVGRHCAACQTQVVDFTRLTDGEVVTFLAQYHPVRRCGRFREDQVGRELLAAARPVTGWRRWAVAAVLLGSAFGMKARAQGAAGPNTRHLAPAATSATYSGVPDSMFLVRGVVRNKWGVRKAGARVRIRDSWYGVTDSKGRFQALIPRSWLRKYIHLGAFYKNPRSDGKVISIKLPLDSTRTKPYHLTLKKQVYRNPGFF